MSNIIAIMATVIFCATSSMDNDNKCPDGSEPIKYTINILSGQSDLNNCYGQGKSGEILDELKNKGNYIGCMPKYKTLDSIIEIEEGNQLIFKLKPNGEIETNSSYKPDLAAKAFWLAVFGAYGPAAKIWNEGKGAVK